MHLDPYTNIGIHTKGFWKKTNCLLLETSIDNKIKNFLIENNYEPTRNNAIFRKGSRQVVVSLVDDFISKINAYRTPVPFLLEKDDIVITDNYVSCPTQYRVEKLPASFYGIYYPGHSKLEHWEPDRKYSFSVNRMDQSRFILMLELARYTPLSQGYVNFNCQVDYYFDSEEVDKAALKQNFLSFWHKLSDDNQVKYRESFDCLANSMPYRNYSIDFEKIFTKSLLNIVVETYAGPYTVALSEKIFRTMTQPAPWIIYGGTHSVSYLSALGFDTLRDFVNHTSYDFLRLTDQKEECFLGQFHEISQRLNSASFDTLAVRCQQAAKNNLDLLRYYAMTWHSDFENWKDRFAEILK